MTKLSDVALEHEYIFWYPAAIFENVYADNVAGAPRDGGERFKYRMGSDRYSTVQGKDRQQKQCALVGSTSVAGWGDGASSIEGRQEH